MYIRVRWPTWGKTRVTNRAARTLFHTDAPTAELVKLAENAYRDVNIALANELSVVCDQLNINVWRVIELANRHPRVSILQPGAG